MKGLLVAKSGTMSIKITVSKWQQICTLSKRETHESVSKQIKELALYTECQPVSVGKDVIQTANGLATIIDSNLDKKQQQHA